MTANDVAPVDEMSRVSSTDRSSERHDSTQQERKPSGSSQQDRRPSLNKAVRRASYVIGDGVCESWKELRMIGILPEPESEDEDESGLNPAATAPAEQEDANDDPNAADSVCTWNALAAFFCIWYIY